jgi:hypothetical protein
MVVFQHNERLVESWLETRVCQAMAFTVTPQGQRIDLTGSANWTTHPATLAHSVHTDAHGVVRSHSVLVLVRPMGVRS